ncbi:MAG: arginine--tRNA ligase [Candidatus Babeliales bacterium]
MNIIEQIRAQVIQAVKQLSPETPEADIIIQLNLDAQKQQFGDLTCNAPLMLAKKLGEQPRALAQKLITTINHPSIAKIEIAGAGFLNVFFTQEAFNAVARELHAQKSMFFTAPHVSKMTYDVEYVSANPTGPLHLGHGRGGIIGDVLSNILHLIGHGVIREFYINDAGSQIQKLGISFRVRCMQQLGLDIAVPEDGYHGEYLVELARDCATKLGDQLQTKDDVFFAQYAKDNLLKKIQHTLNEYGIRYDVWFSEKTLHSSDAITQALQLLEQRGKTYTKDDALWFTSTEYGDDKDRVLRKSSGELTYIAADVAYLRNKFERAQRLVFVLGQDHHSYAVRLKGIAAALGYNPDMVDVILYQLVTLKEDGELLRMSKRAGTMVGLQEIIDTVGTDVARFFYLNRKADAHLDFDIALALKKTDENPVYYIQYAYVRTLSILAKAQEHAPLQMINETDAAHMQESERVLLKKISALKELLSVISNNYQTHLLSYYVLELAQQFHAYYARHTIIDINNEKISRARLLMTTLVKDTIALSLDLLGLSKPTKM